MLHIHANKLVYCVIPGNNSELVKYAMKNAPHRKVRVDDGVLTLDVIAFSMS